MNNDNLRVCFIDVDGVLNNTTSAFLGTHGVNPEYTEYKSTSVMDHGCVRLFQLLCKETSSMFVLSSVWRKHKTNDFTRVLEWCGFNDWKDYYLGNTPILNGIRGEEINKYLIQNPNIKNYVIIDDDSDMLEKQMSHLVQTNGDIGFTVHDYFKALEILQRK